MNNKNKGFSLIELSVVLLISGILITGGITTTNMYIENQKYEETVRKMNFIMQTIEKFATADLDFDGGGDDGWIPCPSDPLSLLGASSFGINYSSAPDLGDGDCSSGISNLVSSGNKYMGIVPVAMLNLPREYALDGWGRRFTYVVDQRASLNGWVGDGELNVESMGGILLKNLSSDTGTYADMILISHGANGYNAFAGRGGERTPFDGFANENRTELVGGVIGNFIQDKLSRGELDDILLYRKMSDLVN